MKEREKSPEPQHPSSWVSTQGKYAVSFSLHFTIRKHVLLWAYSRYMAPHGVYIFSKMLINICLRLEHRVGVWITLTCIQYPLPCHIMQSNVLQSCALTNIHASTFIFIWLLNVLLLNIKWKQIISSFKISKMFNWNVY